MNRLFRTLRNIVERPPATQEGQPTASPSGFDSRIEVLSKYAERASAYESDLTHHYEQYMDQLYQLQEAMENAIDAGHDRNALEFLRLAARLRPQRDLIEQELRAFNAVAANLQGRIALLMENLDEARYYIDHPEENPAATYYLDQTLNRLTRHFVMLEKVSVARHRSLPSRLAEQMMVVLDDHELDLEMAHFILQRRRALGSGGV